jgi:hypothetical protein
VALEMALVAPLLIALVLGILHTALIFLAQEGLETAAENAGRLIMTGQAQQGAMTQAQFKSAACASLPISCNVRGSMSMCPRWPIMPARPPPRPASPMIRAAMSATASPIPPARGSIVVVRLMYLWPTSNGPLGLNLTNTSGGNRMLMATSVLKTEYY